MTSRLFARLNLWADDRPAMGALLRSPNALSRECLAGIVTALALVPEVISFSIVAGVDPKVSLFASITLAATLSLIGGRPAMVSAAAGSVALVIAPLVHAYGVGYILPTILLAGFIQFLFGAAGLHRFMNFVPRSVMIGFINALGVLIFAAQVPHLIDVPWLVYPLFVLTVGIVLLLPRFTRAVPAPLVAIVVVTAIAISFRLQVPDVGGGEPLPPGLPGLTELTVPLDLETLRIVWPTALSVAFVGLLETLLTAKLVDEMTDSRSRMGQESWALGIGNILAGLWGGIGGCAMIGQTVVNVKFGRARSRLSTLVAALVLLLLVTGLSDLMARIPMIALAGVMMVVAVTTIDWKSLQPATLRRMPAAETTVMVVTTALVVATGNLAFGVAVGVLLAMALLAFRQARLIHVERVVEQNGTRVHYHVRGPLFFASSHGLADHFAHQSDPDVVTIDFTRSQIWDASSVAVLKGILEKYHARGAETVLVGLDEHSHRFYTRLSDILRP